jgi:hypothetical protein
MNFKRCAISFALLAMVLGGLSLPASAATYKGTFTLPSETVWGSAVLEPGEYTVYTDSAAPTPFLRIEGNGKAVSVLSGAVDFTEPSFNVKGKIEITEVNGTNVVTKLKAEAIGREFSFSVPRSVKRGSFPAVALKKAAIPVSNTH